MAGLTCTPTFEALALILAGEIRIDVDGRAGCTGWGMSFTWWRSSPTRRATGRRACVILSGGADGAEAADGGAHQAPACP
jgi:hypothetical protein